MKDSCKWLDAAQTVNAATTESGGSCALTKGQVRIKTAPRLGQM